MILLCQTCGGHPVPSLQSSLEQIDRLSESYHNFYEAKFYQVKPFIAGLADYVQNLKIELEIAKKALQLARVLLSAPISKAPDDILVCIFRELLTPPAITTNTQSLEPGPAFIRVSEVLRYSSVCKRWRDIIVSMPEFWTHFDVFYSITDSRRRLSHLQIHRSGALPLKVRSFDGLSPSTLDVLEPVLGRVKSLNTSVEYDILEETLSATASFPNLQQIYLDIQFEGFIDIEDHGDAIRSVKLTLSPTTFTSLTDVTLSVDYRLESISLPWAQLTRLRVDLLTGGDFDPPILITGLEKIETLELNLALDLGQPASIHNLDVNLPHLTSLALTGSQDCNLAFVLLQQANLPLLKELRFTLNLINDGHLFVDAMRKTKIRSLTRLKLNLNIRYNESSSALEMRPVLDSLRVFEHLEEFKCNVDTQPRAADYVFSTLSHNTPSGEPLFPQLRILLVTQGYCDRQALASMQQFLQNRVSTVDEPLPARKPLSVVEISFDGTDHDDGTDYENDGFSVQSVPLKKEVFRPASYNDAATTVTASLQVRTIVPLQYLHGHASAVGL